MYFAFRGQGTRRDEIQSRNQALLHHFGPVNPSAKQSTGVGVLRNSGLIKEF